MGDDEHFVYPKHRPRIASADHSPHDQALIDEFIKTKGVTKLKTLTLNETTDRLLMAGQAKRGRPKTVGANSRTDARIVAMSKVQKALYYKLVRNGVAREEAIMEAMKP